MQAAEQPSITPADIVGFLRRRLLAIMLTGALVLAIGTPIALLWPPLYRSTATILIEEQEIPRELVRSTVTTFADERIQVISQQIMTRATLMQLVQRYDLYPRQRRHVSNEDIIERMRRDIKLTTVNAEVTDRRSGNRTAATIAFKLSFDNENPGKAQKVASELVTLYLNENLKTRKQKAEETSAFLAEEAGRLNAHISRIEAELARFKRANFGRLPELMQLNMQLRDRAESDLTDTDRQIRLLEERRIYLEGQLAALPAMARAAGDRAIDPEERLRLLRTQFASLSGVYTPGHPDLRRLQREIEGLEKLVGPGTGLSEARLVEARAALVRLRERYAEDHPDVAKQRRALAALEVEAKEAPRSGARAREDERLLAENPMAIGLRAQLESTVKEAESLRRLRGDLQKRMAEYQSRLEQTPQVEQRYLDLTRDHENSVAKFREIRAKQMEAEVAQVLETERKGERFSLIDPPQFPERPYRPNRRLLLAMVLAVSLGSGFGFAGLRESLDGSVRGSRRLASALEVPVLAVIPYVSNPEEQVRRRRWILAGLAGGSICLAAGLAVLHFAFIPLDTLLEMVLRRLRF